MTTRGLLASWFAPLLIHGQNQQTAMMRAAAAKAQGLDPNIYGVPLPGSNVTSTTNVTGKGWLPGAILGVALAAAGGLGSLWVASHGGPGPSPGPAGAPNPPAATAPAPAAPPAPAPKPVPGYEWDEIEQQQQPDGTWKDTGNRVRKRMNADGTVSIVSSAGKGP